MRYLYWPNGPSFSRKLASDLKADLIEDIELLGPPARSVVVSSWRDWPQEHTAPLLGYGCHLLLLPPFPVDTDLVARAGGSHSVIAVTVTARNHVRLTGQMEAAVGRPEVHVAYNQVLQSAITQNTLATGQDGRALLILVQPWSTHGSLALTTLQLTQPSALTNAVDRRELLHSVATLLAKQPVAIAEEIRASGVHQAQGGIASPNPTPLPSAQIPLLNLALIALALAPETEWNAERLREESAALTLSEIIPKDGERIWTYLNEDGTISDGKLNPHRLEENLQAHPGLRSALDLARRQLANGR